MDGVPEFIKWMTENDKKFIFLTNSPERTPQELSMKLKRMGLHSSDIAFIGDRMDTDVIAGIESGIDSVLVLSGVSSMDSIKDFPYRPKFILNGICDLVTDM